MAIGVWGGKVRFDKVAVYEGAGAGFDPFGVVGVKPIVEGTSEAVADGVGVDVAAKVEQVVFVGNGFDFDGPFKNGAAVLVFEVVGFAVAVEDALGEQADARGVVLADEDPRGEDPMQIIREIAAGCEGENPSIKTEGRLIIELDRRKAIRRALEIAEPGDVLLFLGKGHEGNIIYADHSLEWDEAQVVAEEISRLRGTTAQ